MEACALNNLYVIIQKMVPSRKSEEDVMIKSFVNPSKDFDTPFGFLMFSGGIERDQWHEIS